MLHAPPLRPLLSVACASRRLSAIEGAPSSSKSVPQPRPVFSGALAAASAPSPAPLLSVAPASHRLRAIAGTLDGCLVGGRAPLEPHVRCPYCGARVWSVTAAGLAPRSACRRLGAHEGRLEYFVCVSGHLHGSCWLARLSSSVGEGDGGSGSRSDDGFGSEEEDDRRMVL